MDAKEMNSKVRPLTKKLMFLAFSVALVGGVSSPAMAADVAQAPTIVSQANPNIPAPEPSVTVEEATENLSVAEQELYKSEVPTTIIVDAKTAEVISVQATNVYARATSTSVCNKGQGCYQAKSPYAGRGVSGQGTITGKWLQRTGYSAGDRAASACSTYTCYAKTPKNSIVIFKGTATGTSFTNY